MLSKGFPKALLVYVGIALVIMLPLLKPGYILSVDMVFTPKIPLPSAVTTSYPFWAVLHYLNLLFPSQIIEKLLLLGMLIASGYGAYRLTQYLQPKLSNIAMKWMCYFAGVLYMVNPFVYSRFMAGQFAVLLGYALVPFFIFSLWKFYERPGRNKAFLVVAWTTFIAIVSIHTILPVLLIALVLGCRFVWRQRGDSQWRRDFFTWAGVIVGGVIILNSYWLIPLLLGTSQTAHIIDGFTQSDLKAFATNPRGFGLVGNVFGLQGFWGDSKNLFLVPQDVFSWWRIPIILLWGLVAYGVVASWRRQRGLTVAFLLIAFLGVGLSIGTSGTFVTPINRWLVNDVPFFTGYREPQKFVMLIVLAYAYFGGMAVGIIAQYLQTRKKAKEHAQTIAFVLCLIPVLCAPLLPWGFHGQLHANDYPVEWYAINDRLGAECVGNCKVLYLPWHLYMRYDFAGRIVADPAPKFFTSQIIASNDPELQGATPYTMTAAQKAIADTILPAVEHGKDVGLALRQYGIHFVLLAKENDYKKYSYLDAQKSLHLVLDTPTLTLYEVSANHG